MSKFRHLEYYKNLISSKSLIAICYKLLIFITLLIIIIWSIVNAIATPQNRISVTAVQVQHKQFLKFSYKIINKFKAIGKISQ